VNTCGWVEGLGKEITTELYNMTRPDVLLTMHKSQKAM